MPFFGVTLLAVSVKMFAGGSPRISSGADLTSGTYPRLTVVAL